MFQYLIRRSLMMLPTLFGITVLSFVIINLAPGSPLEQKLQQLQFAGGQGNGGGNISSSNNMGVSQEVIAALTKQYGFDKPIHVRYWIWIKNLSRLDFGNSFTYEEPVIDVILSKMPVSLQFGLSALVLIYLFSIPLGVYKAVHDGSSFDGFSSFLLFIMYSIPPLMFAILLVTFFSSGQFFEWFPIGDLYSDNYDELSFFDRVTDRIHHFILPLASYLIGSFTLLTFLMKNSLLDIIQLDFVRTARAKGLSEGVVVYKHALRNALIPIVTGLGSFLGLFFAGSLIIEQIFNLDGMGLLGYNSVLSRDYNVLMALIFLQSGIVLIGRLISDLAYVVVDPRINFS